MGQYVNVVGYEPAGEPWSNQHGTFQTYWVQVEGLEQSVMMNKKVGSVPKLGANYGNVIQATSQKGNQYLKWQGEKVPQGTAVPAFAQQPQAPTQVPQAAPAAVPGMVGGEVPGWAVPMINQMKTMAEQVQYIWEQMKAMDLDAAAQATAAANRESYTPPVSTTTDMPANFLQQDEPFPSTPAAPQAPQVQAAPQVVTVPTAAPASQQPLGGVPLSAEEQAQVVNVFNDDNQEPQQ